MREPVGAPVAASRVVTDRTPIGRLQRRRSIVTVRRAPPCVSSSASCGNPPALVMNAIHSSSGDHRGWNASCWKKVIL